MLNCTRVIPTHSLQDDPVGHLYAHTVCGGKLEAAVVTTIDEMGKKRIIVSCVCSNCRTREPEKEYAIN